MSDSHSFSGVANHETCPADKTKVSMIFIEAMLLPKDNIVKMVNSSPWESANGGDNFFKSKLIRTSINRVNVTLKNKEVMVG